MSSEEFLLLEKEYAYAKQELFYYMEKYDKNETYHSVGVSLVGVMIALAGSANFDMDVRQHPFFDINQPLGTFIIILLSIISNYIFVMSISSLYYIILNSARLRFLEEQLNILLNKNLIVWESKIIPIIHNSSNIYILSTNLVNINYAKGLFFISLHLCFQCIFGYVLYKINFWICLVFMILTCLIYTFIISQWYFYLRYLFNILYDIISNIEERNMNMNKNIDITSMYIYGTTITFGFLPMLLSALNDGTVFYGNVKLPLILYTSIYIGDFIILPFFNAYFYKLYKNTSGQMKKTSKWIIWIISIIISLLVNYYTHFKMWTSDSLDSFMDVNGTLTTSGYVHFLYSTIQMGIILFFLYFISSYYRKEYKNYLLFKLTRRLILLFTLLQIPDFIIRNFSSLSRGESFWGVVSGDFTSLLTIVVAIIVLWIIPYKRQGVKFSL